MQSVENNAGQGINVIPLYMRRADSGSRGRGTSGGLPTDLGAFAALENRKWAESLSTPPRESRGHGGLFLRTFVPDLVHS
jgi:hypothetical protein